jgi:hypothetical protein
MFSRHAKSTNVIDGT